MNKTEKMIDLLYKPFKLLYENTIYYETYPFISFIIIIFYTFWIIKYSIYMVETITSYFPIS